MVKERSNSRKRPVGQQLLDVRLATLEQSITWLAISTMPLRTTNALLRFSRRQVSIPTRPVTALPAFGWRKVGSKNVSKFST